MSTTVNPALPTAIQSPSDIAFAKNKVPYKLKPGSYQNIIGDIASFNLVFTANYTAGKTLTLAYNSLSLSFTSVDQSTSTDFDGKKIPIKDSGTTWAAFGAIITQWFNYNFYLSRDYVITYTTLSGSATIIFTAKNRGSAYNAVLTTDISSCTKNIVTTGTDDAFNPNYSLYVELWAESSQGAADFSLVYTAELSPYYDGTEYICDFDAATILKTIVKPTLPGFSTGAQTLAANNMVNYYLRIADKFGSPQPAIQAMLQLPTKMVAAAGLQFNHWTKTKNFASYGGTLNFLSWLTNTRTTGRDQRQFLYFFNPATLDPTLQVKVYNGIHLVATIYLAVFTTWDPNTILIIFAGIPQLGLDTVSYPFDSYQVNILDSNNSNAFVAGCTFNVDPKSYRYSKYLLYSNGLGGFDTLHLTGADELRTNVTHNEATLATDGNYTVPAGEYIAFDKTDRPAFTTSTGYRYRQDIERLRDLLLSEQVYEISDTGYQPIIIRDAETVLINKIDDIYALSLIYDYAYNNPAYSEF